MLQKKGYEEVSDFTTDPAIIIIAVGVCIFIVSFCGSVGALRENICLLKAVSFNALPIFDRAGFQMLNN